MSYPAYKIIKTNGEFGVKLEIEGKRVSMAVSNYLPGGFWSGTNIEDPVVIDMIIDVLNEYKDNNEADS